MTRILGRFFFQIVGFDFVRLYVFNQGMCCDTNDSGVGYAAWPTRVVVVFLLTKVFTKHRLNAFDVFIYSCSTYKAYMVLLPLSLTHQEPF